MDLVSQSVEKLQPLPSGPAEENKGPQEAQWLQNLLEYSERGSKEAQFSMGQYYLRQGQLPVAVQYLMKAEQANSGQARYQLAVMYYDGLGMEADAVCVHHLCVLIEAPCHIIIIIIHVTCTCHCLHCCRRKGSN